MTPKCCQECRHLDKHGNCVHIGNCRKWREWFHREWSDIRKAAALIKERREYKQDKLDELRRELLEERSEGK